MANAITQLIATQAQRNAPTSPMQAVAGMQQLDANKQRMQMNDAAMQNDQQAMMQQKRQEGLKFAANVGAQMREAGTPQEKAEIYETSMQIAKMNGHDIQAFPQTYNQDADNIMEGIYMQVYQPEEMKKRFLESTRNMPQSALGKLAADRERVAQAGGDTSMFDEALAQAQQQPQSTQTQTASQSDFATYQRLKKTDPEAAEQFGRRTGFVSKEGQDLSAHIEKRLSKASDDVVEAGNTSRRLTSLAKEFETVDVGGGLFGSTWAEKLKTMTGTQDAVTALRKKYNGLRASQAVANLPPGAASDKDIDLALSGFPDANANGEHIANWLRGTAKLEEFRRDFAQHKADYITENGHERGMLNSWHEKHPRPPGETDYSAGQVIEANGQRYRVLGGDPANPNIELIQ